MLFIDIIYYLSLNKYITTQCFKELESLLTSLSSTNLQHIITYIYTSPGTCPS